MSATASVVRTRVAPSPTGEPHIGNMYAALFCKAFAHQRQGVFVLRLEDTDRRRFVARAVDQLPEALHWLGLDPDESPARGGPYAPYVQSERLPLYHQAAADLILTGHGYRCFCTPERLEAVRQEQMARKEPTRYDRRCLHLPSGEIESNLRAGVPHTVRLRIPDAGTVEWDDAVRGHVSYQCATLTDQILLKSDGFPTSHLGIPYDDHAMRISHVIRAEEWLPSVPYYILLFHAFGWELPVFAHLSILRNADRSKMSKRKNPTSVMWYRSQGFLPQAIVNFLALQGWSHPEGKEFFTFEEFAARLTLERIVTSGPIFDFTKLDWMNGRYIAALSLQELAEAAEPFLPEPVARPALLAMLPLVRDRMKRLNEIGNLTEFLRHDPDASSLPFEQAVKKRSVQDMYDALQVTSARIKELVAPDAATFEHTVRATAEELGWKAGDVFMLLRVAVTGSSASPPLYESCATLGWQVVCRRLDAALTSLAVKQASPAQA